MKHINNVELLGNLGKEPEIKTFNSGATCMNLSLATSYGEGEQKKTEWHNVVFWAKKGQNITTTLKKGDIAKVHGRISYESWTDKDGIKKYMTKIVAFNVSSPESETPVVQVTDGTQHQQVQSEKLFDDDDINF